ncbi:hypothetical protein RvY_12955 [Ramazzottius varieornatus]|uniref:39S ribosomal protein L41, mitochondrial n=1 Tax=Ramazzottius varieornatus TaxID=947166 RepID=A0A1D1VN73_RAMVA|nr:hypothetical protein RvY_12955 [Ramazzottius varieornatus]
MMMHLRPSSILFRHVAKSPCCSVTEFSTSASVFGLRKSRKGPKTTKDIPWHQQHYFYDKMEHEYPEGLHGRGVRPIGYRDPTTRKFHVVPEMIPELVVPDLTDFKLKPYVSYKVPDTVEAPMSARDLFDAVYGRRIKDEFDDGKLEAEVKEVLEKEQRQELTRHSYDTEPPRMLDSTKRPVV